MNPTENSMEPKMDDVAVAHTASTGKSQQHAVAPQNLDQLARPEGLLSMLNARWRPWTCDPFRSSFSDISIFNWGVRPVPARGVGSMGSIRRKRKLNAGSLEICWRGIWSFLIGCKNRLSMFLLANCSLVLLAACCTCTSDSSSLPLITLLT